MNTPSTTITITPKRYHRAQRAAEEATKQMYESIRAMRASDQKYWSLGRLAAHWKISKPIVAKALKGKN